MREREKCGFDKAGIIINMIRVLGLVMVIIGTVRAEFQVERFEKAGEVGWLFGGPARESNEEITNMYR